jgi:hypothetical protein
MWLIFVEAGVALFLLVFIVWWTMSGRKPDDPAVPDSQTKADPKRLPDDQNTDAPT